MIRKAGIVANIDRCIGCFSCEVACKQENNPPEGKQRIKVHQLGPEEINGKLYMEFIPLMTENCTLCSHRVLQGLEPFCVSSCPVQALIFGTTEGILELLETGKGYQATKLLEVDVPTEFSEALTIKEREKKPAA